MEEERSSTGRPESWKKAETDRGRQKKKPINYGSIRINQPHDPMSGGRRKPALSVVKVGKILKPKETGQDGSGRC